MLSCIRGEERLYVCVHRKQCEKLCCVKHSASPRGYAKMSLHRYRETKLPQHDEKQNLPGIICVESVSSFSLCGNYRLSWVFERTTE